MLQVPQLPKYEPDEVAFGEDRNTAFYELLDAYGRVLRLGDLMWQHHFEFLLLGYGAYATFAEFCKGNLPDIPAKRGLSQMRNIFLFCGLTRADKPQRFRLEHGDIAVWGGPARLRFHGVAPLADGEHALMGRQRINLTFRKAR